MAQKLNTAVMLTGAAARISQEVAMLDQLMAKHNLVLSQDETLLAGFSSGSLNLAAINACFSNGSQLGWDSYYKQQVLFPLQNDDVYKITGLPFDTSPLRNTVQKFVDKMNCKWVGDLPFYSYILTFSWKELQTLWACSKNQGQEHLNITDMFMSSTAIPILFPSQEIHCESGYTSDFPDGKFADGGTGGTFKRFSDYIGKYVRENGQFTDLYIISPMREKSQSEHKEILEMAEKHRKEDGILSHLTDYLKNISMITFMKFLEELDQWEYNGKPMAQNIYVSIPEMEKNFPILNFDDQEIQYKTTMDWVDNNQDKLAVPLKQFIKEHQSVLKEA